MNYKRIEMYVWWTCNQKCTYCMEFSNMEKTWNKKVTKYEILKKLIEYKKQGYNHVTYLWWEPFIQEVFLDALLIWKKLKFTILVTTNATTLHIEKEAKKFLPNIDELILSVEAIDKELQQKISRTNVYVRWEEVFNNINRYWKWSYLKVNIVITRDNLIELVKLVQFVVEKWVKNIAITYPDIDERYYWEDHIKTFVAPTYKESMQKIELIEEYCNSKNINLKIVDFPFCVFPNNKREKFILKTDDFDYWTRIKITNTWEKLDRKETDLNNEIPREREYCEKCKNCKYYKICWWPSRYYEKYFWLDEINPIKNDNNR